MVSREKIRLACLVGLLSVLLHLDIAEGYSGGAPIDACTGMTPRHGLTQRSTERSPFVILVSKDNFGPNESIMVMLRGLCKNTFRGFLVEARRADPRFNQTELVGSFTAVQGSRYECGREAALTHITNDDKSSLLFNWTSPSQSIGHIVITATFVQRFSNFWVGVNSAVITDNMARFPLGINPSQLVTPYITPCPEDLPQTSTTTSTTTTTTTPTTTTTTTISTTTTATTTTTTRPPVRVTTPWVTTPRQVLPTPAPTTPPFVPKTTSTTTPARTTVGLDDKGGKCGTTRGCFNLCVEKDCTFNVQWRDMGDRVWFSISVKVLPDTPDQWVALGMSHDNKMGDDSVVECLSQGGRRSMSISYNYQRSNRRMNPMNPVIFPISDTMADGVLTCEFVRAKMVPGNDKIYNLDKSWYMLIAQGPIVSGRMERHTNLPWVSRYRVDLKSTQQMQVAFGDRIFIKVHACAMTFAWMFLASIAIVVARFYKPMWPQSRVCGRKLWFTIHRMCTILLALLVVGAFVVIFLEVKGLSDISFLDFRKIHPILGMIVTGLTIIQAAMGLFRPKSTSTNRPVFNWAHWCVGIIDHILAVMNIILGVGLKKAGVHKYVSYILYCFAVYQVFIVLILEVVACNSRIKERKQQSYSIYADRSTRYSSTKDVDTDDTEPPGGFTRRVILRVHVLVITAFTGCVIAIIAIS